MHSKFFVRILTFSISLCINKKNSAEMHLAKLDRVNELPTLHLSSNFPPRSLNNVKIEYHLYKIIIIIKNSFLAWF